MDTTVWLCADTLSYPEGGGHRWAYLNWALGLRSLGCNVIWLEAVDPEAETVETVRLLEALEATLERYELNGIALCSRTDEPLSPEVARGGIDLDLAGEADLLLNMAYDACSPALGRFRRTALLDIDPGLSQVWATQGVAELPPHDVYFTIGETVGQAEALFPDAGVSWQYTPPCVALDWWPRRPAAENAPFTTVSHWADWMEWVTHDGQSYPNDKRAGFLPFLDLPRRALQPIELALCLEADEELRLAPYEEEEQARLEQHGWRVVHAHAIAGTPWDYQDYIGRSRGEFSWVKPSCIRLQNAWISDRTLCYLASGKPAVVQHTGPSRFLPEAEGLFRFRDVEEAARHLEKADAEYDKHCAAARALAEERFDAGKVVAGVLELALP